MKKNHKIKAAPHFPNNNAPRRQEHELVFTGSPSVINCDFWSLRLRAGCLRKRFLAFGHACIIFLTETAPRPELNTLPSLLSEEVYCSTSGVAVGPGTEDEAAMLLLFFTRAMISQMGWV